MKKKSKAAGKGASRETGKIAKKRAVRGVRSKPISTETAATNQDMLFATLGELVGISGDIRELLIEIRDLLAEGAEQEGQAPEERGAGVEAVIIAETEPGEDIE